VLRARSAARAGGWRVRSVVLVESSFAAPCAARRSVAPFAGSESGEPFAESQSRNGWLKHKTG